MYFFSGLLLIGIGFLIIFYVKRRIFYRTNSYGVQEFSRYSSVIKNKLYESILDVISTVLILGGIFILFSAKQIEEKYQENTSAIINGYVSNKYVKYIRGEILKQPNNDPFEIELINCTKSRFFELWSYSKKVDINKGELEKITAYAIGVNPDGVKVRVTVPALVEKDFLKREKNQDSSEDFCWADITPSQFKPSSINTREYQEFLANHLPPQYRKPRK